MRRLYGAIALVGLLVGCSRPPAPPTGLSLNAYHIDAKANRAVELREGMLAARFCGCGPCRMYARSLSTKARGRLELVTFTVPAETVVKFRNETSWPSLGLIESDAGWRKAWKDASCPVVARFSSTTQCFEPQPLEQLAAVK